MSLYVKRTQKYMYAFKICTLSAVGATIVTNIMLNTYPTVFLAVLCMSTMGFLVTPILPLTYEALVTGILNGGGMLFSFLLIGAIELVFGIGSK
jgi:hypothetical protein